jgi:uncharacterized protein (TIGR02266 family)
MSGFGTRRHERHATEEQVTIHVPGRDALYEMYTRDISKGGMFIASDTPMPQQSRIEVTLATPDGDLVLRGEVVHVLDAASAAAYGQQAGMGVQFVDLTPEREERLNAYLVGLEASPGDGDVEAARETTAAVADAVRNMLRQVDNGDLYGGLGVTPEASDADIAGKLAALEAQLTGVEGRDAAENARLERGRRALKKIRMMLADPARRVAYDFRVGYLFIEERRQRARTGGPSLAACRAAWQEVFGSKVAEAAGYAKEAVTRFRAGGFDDAYELGLRAMDLDPFNEELREALAMWKRMATGR